MEAVIPPRSHRNEPRKLGWFVYKERHLIEHFFNKIKHYRMIFSRFEKLARNYMGFLRFVSALIWLTKKRRFAGNARRQPLPESKHGGGRAYSGLHR